MKKIFLLLSLITALSFLIYSCSKENETTVVSPGSVVRTTISGMVLNENNTAVANVTVSAYGETTTTNQFGTFVLKNVSVGKNRSVMQFEKAGYFNRTHAFIPSANSVNYVRVVLTSSAQTHTLSASAGGTVSLADGSSIQFAPNSFVLSDGTAYTGTVALCVKHLSPDDSNFGFSIPGGDLLGKDAGNKDVALYSYGMLGVELKSLSGQTLQLTPGTTATLTLSIAASQTATAPASVPLWYFDESTSLWREQGTATKVGNNYVGTVKHFSWWNCDYCGPVTFIKGKVVDCDKNPLPNVVVYVEYFTIHVYGVFITDQNGNYFVRLFAGYPFTVQVLANLNSGITLDSQLENVPALSPNQVYIIPDLVTSCPTYITCNLTKCNNGNIDGMVNLSFSSGSSFQYSSNGIFKIACPPVSAIDLYASSYYNSAYFSFTHQYASLAGGTLNVGNILLCDSTVATTNNFVIDGGPFSNQLFSVIPTSSTTILGSVGGPSAINVRISGTAPGYSVTGFYIYMPDTIPATYPWSTNQTMVAIFFNSPTVNYAIQSAFGTTGIVTLSQIGGIGERIKGSFSGNAQISETGGGGPWTNVTISGNFDGLRTQ